MKKIIKYFYTGYYKFFKLWQADDDAARNSKAMIALALLLIGLGIIHKLYSLFISKQVLDIGGKYRGVGYLITLPLIIFVMSSIKDSYPNDEDKNLVRGIIVTLTVPLAFGIMVLLVT